MRATRIVVVVGQPIPGDGGFSGALANAVLLHGGRPVLVVPRDYTGDAAARHVVIAWKESREAARAVADALPLLERAERVTVLAFDAPGREDGPGGHAAEHIVTWLLRHHITSTLVRAEADEGHIAQSVLAHAADVDGDLVVMGGYSRPRLQEIVLGGVTRDMLADDDAAGADVALSRIRTRAARRTRGGACAGMCGGRWVPRGRQAAGGGSAAMVAQAPHGSQGRLSWVSSRRIARSFAFTRAALPGPMRIIIFCPADRASRSASANW